MPERNDEAPEDIEEEWRLLERAATGDGAAFAEFVSRHYRAGLAFCHQIVGDRQKAEDIVQKGFVNLYQAQGRYEHRARVKTLLFKVFLNLCINEINRKSENHQTFSALSDPESGPAAEFRDAAAADPRTEALDREMAEMVRRAILRLNPRHRAALYLREYGDLSYGEIAQTLSASLAEVKIWIHRGRLAIQEILRPYIDRGESIR